MGGTDAPVTPTEAATGLCWLLRTGTLEYERAVLRLEAHPAPVVARLQRRLPLLWAGPLLLLDQLSKSWALGQLAGGETLPLLPPYIQLTLVENRGMVFGLLPDWGEALTVWELVVVGWLLLAYPRLAARPLERLGRCWC